MEDLAKENMSNEEKDSNSVHGKSIELNNLNVKTLGFQAALMKFVEDVVESVTEKEFTCMYKELISGCKAKENTVLPLAGTSAEAKKFRNQLKELITTQAEESVEEMIKTHDLNNKFQKLEEFKNKSKDVNRKAWRPNGDTKDHINLQDCSMLLIKKEMLVDMLAEDDREMKMIDSELDNDRKLVKEFHTDIKNCNEKMKEILKHCDNDNVM